MVDILKIDLSVDVDNLEKSLFEIYKKLRPDAEKSKTVFQELKGGFVNFIYILYPENKIEKAIVFRTFGNKKNEEIILKLNEEVQKKGLYEDKNLEFKNDLSNNSNEVLIMRYLSQHNLCKPIHAKYLNGICFSYATGTTSNGFFMSTNDYLDQMSTKLAKFHSCKIDLPDTDFETHYDKIFQLLRPKTLPLLQMANQELKKLNEFPYNEYPSFSDLLLEEKNLISKLKEISMGEIGFCHNDLNQKNIIWDPENKELYFIDFEGSMNNYIAFDLGLFFFSFSGFFLYKFEKDLLPSIDYRLKFIEKYLKERYKIKNEIPDEKILKNEISKLFKRTNIFILFQIINIVLISPFFDFKPEFFTSDDTIKDKINIPYYCGKFGLKVFETYKSLKDDYLKNYDEYI